MLNQLPRTIGGVLLAIGGMVFAQAPAEQRPSFEVASVKPAAPNTLVKGEPQSRISITPGTLRMQNVTLHEMILTAYGIREDQLSGPAWLKSAHFDVAAKSEGPADGNQIRLMLQALLADRFKLVTHRETKDLAVLAMVAGKSTSKLGSPKPEGPGTIAIQGSTMLFENWSMPKLAEFLSHLSAGRPVVDSTGLDGYYDFSVRMDTASDQPADVKRAFGAAMRDGSLPMVVAEQIGLKLESRKGPAEVIVVDGAVRVPAAN